MGSKLSALLARATSKNEDGNERDDQLHSFAAEGIKVENGGRGLNFHSSMSSPQTKLAHSQDRKSNASARMRMATSDINMTG